MLLAEIWIFGFAENVSWSFLNTRVFLCSAVPCTLLCTGLLAGKVDICLCWKMLSKCVYPSMTWKGKSAGCGPRIQSGSSGLQSIGIHSRSKRVHNPCWAQGCLQLFSQRLGLFLETNSCPSLNLVLPVHNQSCFKDNRVLRCSTLLLRKIR